MGLSRLLIVVHSRVRGHLHRTLDIVNLFFDSNGSLAPCSNHLSCSNEELLQDPVSYIRICERIPAGRWGEPQDIAGPVIFLASAASQYVCGELLVVDGVRVIVDDVATNGLTLFIRAGWAGEI